MSPTPLTLAALNAASPELFSTQLAGIYEHSPWIAEHAAAARPFATLAQLRQALVQAVRAAPREARLGLIRAHPELAGKAAIAGTLTPESTGEQQRAGLNACTPEEFAQLQRLNADYGARFGFPFIVAVRGPRGTGLARSEIIDSLARRLLNHPDDEFAEALRQIHRIAEIRLDDRLGSAPTLGEAVWDRAEALARHSEAPAVPGAAPELTVTYLTPAHRAVAAELAQWMRDDGFDEVGLDAVGNVVGVYHGSDAAAPRLLTGSHYDTVRRAGKYDGRLGILVAMQVVQGLARAGRRLPFGLELVAFAEEEGQRWPATFLASSPLVGRFDAAWLAQADAQGVRLRDAMRDAGLPGELAAIEALRRDPARYLGFVEVHIEQGPVLHALDLPLGVVSAINGSRRHVGLLTGQASHAGTTPMGQRRDAAAGVAELALLLERCASARPEVVATMGQLEVPGGSVNVVPGRCRFSLDIRATTDAARDACLAEVQAGLAEICQRRGLRPTLTETLSAGAAPCHPAWQQRWAAAVQALGLPVHSLPSGAGHDAMMLHHALPQAMLFVRGQNGGISHNPLEAVSTHDADLAVQAFQQLLQGLAAERASPA
ncbi:2-oxo-4-hydroxy-4-carboxy-5-ureidoimidazoline decarboxylase [Aquabacterium sp. OR-4]|uniref:2-oxo-4-hydroxy-4-carboxy-5-ureidoimidazoline decarboxylase n=1 Tax=Aquabacterium sp. OR-4 TaxID=2978127 RepID=UPI0021B48B1A|nr:2-oxo-4-hydroxy-4-carboxy-5-ureidoimidazoline decarboxylase [Aquabacterium sp. OR-4]MDT7838274.1 2-oxo-4-hydroxy-4-carboxy-5-ureidoimidazoline decarboxylase [Aquabacterium sp. OR-4]